MRERQLNALGEYPPKDDQFRLARLFRATREYITSQVLEEYLAATKCSCSENVDEQIWIPSGRGSVTTQPVSACLHCRAESLTYHLSRLKQGVGLIPPAIESATAVANRTTSPLDRTEPEDRRGGNDQMNR